VERGSGTSQGERRRLFGGAAAVLIALSLAACTAAVSPTPQATATQTAASDSPSPSASPSGLPTGSMVTAAPSPTAAWTFPPSALATPTDTPVSDPTESPTPPLPSGPLPSLGPAPTGNWTGIKWIAVPGGHSPTVPAVPYDAQGYGVTASIEGWSQGYVEFLWSPSKRTLIPWTSADGLRWRAGSPLDTKAWAADFKQVDIQVPGADDCFFEVGNFQEGPATLLLNGDFYCGGGCGGPWFYSSHAFWTSPDGLAWTPLDVARAVGPGGLGVISGGSSGFIALGSAAGKQTTWVSSDGQTWAQGALPNGAFSVSDPVSYAGGFVLPGVVVVAKGHKSTWYGTCGNGQPGYTDLSKYQGALWWSPDGMTWTRDTLTGTVGFGVNMSVARIDDHTLVADEQTFNAGGSLTAETAWVSRDGKSWSRLKGYLMTAGGVIGGSDHGMIKEWSTPAGQTGPTLRVINDKLQLVTLSQTGGQPWLDGTQLALGPTGLLATEEGSRFWIGVPTAG
jgi:hypothetical protein